MYTDGLNLQNITMNTTTPVNISSFLLDPDGDSNPIGNDTDDDNDGILDVDDTLTGDVSWVSGNVGTLNISVNGSYNLSQSFVGNLPVIVMDDDGFITEFDWTFVNTSKMELQNWEINKGFTGGRQWITISGLDLSGTTKIVYLNQTNQSLGGICIYDNDITDISVITEGCTSPLETYIECPGTSGSYECSISSSILNVTGLSYTGIIQNPATTSTTTTTTTIGGGGGGGGSGGSTPEFSTNISGSNVEITDLKIGSGKSASIELKDWSGMIYKIIVFASNTISKASITIEKLESWELWEVPVLSEDQWKAYRYLRVETENLEGKTDSISMYFSMEKDWINKNSINTVGLWRYDGGWKRLDIVKVGETEETINYKSSFTGFSHFAIAGKVGEDTFPDNRPDRPDKNSVCGNGICESGETVYNCASDCETSTEDEGVGWLILPVLIIIVAALVVFFYFKEKKKIKKPKILRLPPPPNPITKIKDIISQPSEYIGKKVMVEGTTTQTDFIPNENRVLYKIKDSSGEMEGKSIRAGYKGKGIIDGVVKNKKRKIYLEF